MRTALISILSVLSASAALAGYGNFPVSGGGSGTVTEVTASAPIQSSGGTAPVISCIAATGLVAGCLSSTDWTTFNGKQDALTFTGTGNTVRATSPTLVTPALGTPSALVGTNITGTASSLTAGSVTTNANLTGPITSSGNATSIASQTGTGTKFVVDTSPVLVTPNLGTPSAVVLTNATGTAASLTAGTATNATNVATTATNSTNSTFFPTFVASSSSGNQGADTDSDLTYNASTNLLTLLGGGLFTSTSGSETTSCGMSSSTRFSCDNTTHANSKFLTYATNTGGVGLGIGSFNNNYNVTMTQANTSTAPATNIAGGAYTVPIFNCRNSNSTAGNFCAVAFSGSSDNPTSYIAGVNVTHTTSSEDGRITFGTTLAGTRSDKVRIEPAGEMIYGGAAVTLASCGTSPAVTAGSVAQGGTVTIGTSPAGTCTINFNLTFPKAPNCWARNKTTGMDITGTETTTTFPMAAAFVAGDVVAYGCTGNI